MPLDDNRKCWVSKCEEIASRFEKSYTLKFRGKISLEDKNKGLIFNIQKFSLHDGPGIRTTVFMKGCPLSCKWCSNPESIKPYPELMTHDIKCIRCGKCVEACPQEAIKVIDDLRRVDRSKCNLCMDCVKVCPSGALQQSGSYISLDELVAEVEKDRLFYLNSGGGVTFSGGEPLLQWEFIREALRRCKEQGLHTVLDTTGCASWDIMERVLDYVDLVLYDVKHIDPDKHREYTGVDNQLIMDNAVKTTAKVRTWLRIPVIPGFNDSEADIRRIVEFGKELSIEKISLLPYHAFGEHKYESLGRDYPWKGTQPPPEEYIQQLQEIVETCGLAVTVGS